MLPGLVLFAIFLIAASSSFNVIVFQLSTEYFNAPDFMSFIALGTVASASVSTAFLGLLIINLSSFRKPFITHPVIYIFALANIILPIFLIFRIFNQMK